MQTITQAFKEPKQRESSTLKVYLSDWLFNAGILGFIRIHSIRDTDIWRSIKIGEDGTYIEFSRDIMHGFTNKFFETAFQFHGKYDSIKLWLEEIKNDLARYSQNGDIVPLAKKFKIASPDEQIIIKVGMSELAKRWKGVAYESFKKIKKSDTNNIRDLIQLIAELLEILTNEREFFVQKEVQTFLRGIIGSGSFLNKSIDRNQKQIFKRDFEAPIATASNKPDKTFNCIHCNVRHAKKNTIFSTGLVFYQGLNKDSVNFVWGFDPNLPLCEICELIYFCHWAGFTKGFKNKSYLFVNDDSNVHDLWRKNQLLTRELEKDRKENILINYFHELLVQEETIKSIFALQNICIVDVDLEKEIMPKVMSLYVSRRQAQYIKANHDKLRWQSTRFYKIKDDYNNILREFLDLALSNRLSYNFAIRLLKYFLQSRNEAKGYVTVNYSPLNLLNIVVLIHEFNRTVKQKNTNMELKSIRYIYYLGNNMRKYFIEQKAENKINSIAYRLLNAVRSSDQSTFLNILLRIYIGANMPVPKNLVNSLENDEKFQIIGLSYINGLLGETAGENQTVSQ